MPAGFQDIEKEKIREKLIQVAVESLPRGGLAKTSLDDIVRSARIAKGSFYLFFSSKEELYIEAFERMEDDFRKAYFSRIEKGEGSPKERLERGFRFVFEMIEANPSVSALDTSLIERLFRKLPAERIAAHQAGDAKAMDVAYARWVAAGLLRPIGTEALMGVTYSLFYLAMHRGDMSPGQWAATKTLIPEALAARLAPEESSS